MHAGGLDDAARVHDASLTEACSPRHAVQGGKWHVWLLAYQTLVSRLVCPVLAVLDNLFDAHVNKLDSASVSPH